MYLKLVKVFYKHACVSPSKQIFSGVMGKKICAIKEMVVKLINHDSIRNRCCKMHPTMEKLDEMANVIFQNGKDSSHANNIHKISEFGSKIFGVAFIIVCPPTLLTMLTTPTRSIYYSS